MSEAEIDETLLKIFTECQNLLPLLNHIYQEITIKILEKKSKNEIKEFINQFQILLQKFQEEQINKHFLFWNCLFGAENDKKLYYYFRETIDKILKTCSAILNFIDSEENKYLELLPTLQIQIQLSYNSISQEIHPRIIELKNNILEYKKERKKQIKRTILKGIVIVVCIFIVIKARIFSDFFAALILGLFLSVFSHISFFEMFDELEEEVYNKFLSSMSFFILLLFACHGFFILTLI